MALEKSPPKSTSALTGATLDIRSASPPSSSPPDHPRHHQASHSHNRPQAPTRCLTYSVRGNESWISPRDMDHLKHLLDAPDQQPPQDTSAAAAAAATGTDRNGNGPRYTLPKGCKLGSMVGEGAANAVFEFQLPDGTHLCHQNTRLLLRVAKEPVDDDRPKFNYLEQEEYYRTRIRPILGQHVLHQELVVIRGSGIIDAINDHLRCNDRFRKDKFKGTWVDQSDYGFLVEDMRPEDENGLLVEFKPKWLSQSPSAPKNAIRCRQCAKELHNYVMEPDLDKPIPTMAKPCPLTLGKDVTRSHARTKSAWRLLPLLDTLGEREHLSATLNVLRDESAFKRLRSAQEENDRVGPLGADQSDANFSLAMTLRDCTCFAQITRRASKGRDSMRPLKVRFGDFDMKSPAFRLDYWQGVEQDLINGGFYTADWIYCSGSYYRPPTSCVLEPSLETMLEEKDVILVNDIGSRSTPYVDQKASCLSKIPKVYVIKTDAERVRECLEAHKQEAPPPTPEQAKRLSFKQNGRSEASLKYTATI